MTERNPDGENATSRRPGSGRAGEQPALSYLVRFWLEPREDASEDAPYRGYARDLRSGEERYFRDPRNLAEHILRRLDAERREDAGSVTGEAAAAIT